MLQPWGDVLLDAFLLVCDAEDAFQLVKVVVTLDNDEKEIREYPVGELRFKPRKRYDKNDVNDKELKELEALERKEGKSHISDD